MKISKLFILVLSSILSVLPVRIANTCSWGYDDDESFLLPFKQELIHFPELYPFLYSYHYWKGGNSDWSESSEQYSEEIFESRTANLQDWSTYFKGNIPIADIEKVIYNTSGDDLNAFAQYAKNNSELSSDWKNNGLVKYWKLNPASPSLQYLQFAKETEVYVKEFGWWDEVERNTDTLNTISKRAATLANKTKDSFIKMRYAYQAMRGAHYAGNYADCLQLFDTLVDDKIDDKSLIYYWCLSLKAGAYWHQNKFAESSYYNALVFDKCLSRRLYSERDFWIDNENTWQRCLAMCKNDHEKSVLWLLTGINQNNSAVAAMQELMILNPASKELELLLAREVEKIQRTYMPERWAEDFNLLGQNEYAPESNALDDILKVILQAEKINHMQTPAYWYNSAAFLYYIKNDVSACESYCEKARQAADGNNDMITQSRIIHILNVVESIQHINKENEMLLQSDLEWLSEDEQPGFTNKKDAYRLVMYNLMNYYFDANKPLEAEMCKARALEYYNIYEEPEKAPISELYNFFINPKNSDFDKYLISEYPYNADDMLEITATLLMRENRIREAVGVFSGMKNKNHPLMKLPADPFVIHINDCHDCDFQDFASNYTKLTLCQTIVELEGKLREKPENSTEILHLLGNAYYNMSYWGNSWLALDYYRCHGCELNRVETGDDYSWYYNDYFSLEKAKYYYSLAATGSRGKEFAALNYFMLAKCEQNDYYRSYDFDYENENGLKENCRNSFSVLLNTYKGTEFYNEAIKECKFFEYYVSNH